MALAEFTRALNCLGVNAAGVCDREMSEFSFKENVGILRTSNSNSLSTWMERVRLAAMAMDTGTGTTGNDSSNSFLRSVGFVDDGSSIDDTTIPHDPSVASNNVFFLFNRAFSIFDANPKTIDTATWLRYTPCILPAIFFNIGLVYHRAAIRTDRTDVYSEALGLYTSALYLLGKNDTCGLSSECNLLLLGLFNNIGHIHSHFYNSVQTLYCRDNLTSVFLSTNCSKLLTKEEFIFFYMNILFAVRRFPMLAPAA